MKHIIDDFSAEEAAQPRRVQVFDAVDDDRLFAAEEMRGVRDMEPQGHPMDDLAQAIHRLFMLAAVVAVAFFVDWLVRVWG